MHLSVDNIIVSLISSNFSKRKVWMEKQICCEMLIFFILNRKLL